MHWVICCITFQAVAEQLDAAARGIAERHISGNMRGEDAVPGVPERMM